jgi:hypothetical protein
MHQPYYQEIIGDYVRNFASIIPKPVTTTIVMTGSARIYKYYVHVVGVFARRECTI